MIFQYQLRNQKQTILWGFISLITYAVLTFYSNLSSTPDISLFIGIISLAFVCYGVVIFCCFKGQLQPTLFLIILFAISFHILGIFAAPQFEDDYFRYLWDGYIFFEQGSPYLKAPAKYFTDESIPYVYQNLLNQINYPEIKTIYAPLFQYSFWLSHSLFPADIIGLKIIYSLFNIGVIIILSKMVDVRFVLLYAWNPLLIKEIAFTAHPDVIGVFFLMLAVYLISTHPKTAATFLGISVCSKPFAWLIAIYFLLRFSLSQWVFFLSAIILLYLPFVDNGSLFSGLTAFGSDWEFNAGIYSLFILFIPVYLAKALTAIILLAILFYCYSLFRNDKSENIRGDIIIGCLLLLAPVFNPWYLVWLLPFAAIHFQIWPWITSFALLLSYFSGINITSSSLQAYELAFWVKPVEYSMIFAAIIYDIKSKLTK